MADGRRNKPWPEQMSLAESGGDPRLPIGQKVLTMPFLSGTQSGGGIVPSAGGRCPEFSECAHFSERLSTSFD